jgi:hypothetical protein
MKDAILKTMEAIINEELDNSNCRLEDVTYKNQRTLINTLFCKDRYEYNKRTILLRLVVINSLYSTSAEYSYFSFDEMAKAILSIGNGNEDSALDYFYEIAKGGKDSKGLFGGEYGIRKNLAKGSQQMSLITKYAYYALLQNREKYPLGFPIYDSLAKEAYPIVCKMLNENEIHRFSPMTTPTIEDYVKCLNQIRSKLFNDNELFTGYQQFDILDAYLWRMGKFEGGNLSLLLEQEEYKNFITTIGLNVEEVGSGKKYNKTMLEKIKKDRENGIITENQYNYFRTNNSKNNLKNDDTKTTYAFNFNKAVLIKLENAITLPFKNEYIITLYTHWRNEYHKTKTMD